MENKKGTICPYKPIICQEGYCCECQVHIDAIASLTICLSK